MADMSSTAISKREGSMLRSKEKANEFCSLLCGYRLLDVIVGLVAYSDKSTQPPVHNKMGINISKNDVRILYFYKKSLSSNVMIYRELCVCLGIGLVF